MVLLDFAPISDQCIGEASQVKRTAWLAGVVPGPRNAPVVQAFQAPGCNARVRLLSFRSCSVAMLGMPTARKG